jgi:hypothetical protein
MSKITIVLIVAIIAALFSAVQPATATELDVYNYVTTHQDNPRNAVILNDLVYQYGTMEKLVTKMNYLATQPVFILNFDAKYNTTTGNIDYTGVWARV